MPNNKIPTSSLKFPISLFSDNIQIEKIPDENSFYRGCL